jgi:hypothetical protein
MQTLLQIGGVLAGLGPSLAGDQLGSGSSPHPKPMPLRPRFSMPFSNRA